MNYLDLGEKRRGDLILGDILCLLGGERRGGIMRWGGRYPFLWGLTLEEDLSLGFSTLDLLFSTLLLLSTLDLLFSTLLLLFSMLDRLFSTLLLFFSILGFLFSTLLRRFSTLLFLTFESDLSLLFDLFLSLLVLLLAGLALLDLFSSFFSTEL